MLANGNIPAYACGHIKEADRYINPKMEQELSEFKIELVRRFKKSKITEWKFPRKLEESGNMSSDQKYVMKKMSYNNKV